MREIFQIFTAFGAGLLTFFTPCVLPLIPAYISFITGMSVEELKGSEESEPGRKKLIRTEILLFILGFSAVFVALGASATFIGTFLHEQQNILRIVGGLIVIAFGLHIMGVFNIRFLNYEKRIRIKSKPLTAVGSLFIGMAFALGWTPCIGPILGSILMMAASEESLYQGIVLLSFYSLGLAIPFLLVSIGIKWALTVFSKIKKYLRYVLIACGILLIIIGIQLIFWGLPAF